MAWYNGVLARPARRNCPMPTSDQIRQRLEQEQQRLVSLVERTSKNLYRREEPYSADFAEQAVEVENKEVVERLDEDGKRQLAEIRHALGRLDDGNYGLCESCGEEINEARLEVLPATRYCVDCAEFST